MKCILSQLKKGVSFVSVKRFRPIKIVANNSQQKFTILHIPHIGFLCYFDTDEILQQGSWLEKKGINIVHATIS